MCQPLLARTDIKKPFSTWLSSMELSSPQSRGKSVLQEWVNKQSLTQTLSSPHNILQGINISIPCKNSATYLWPHSDLAGYFQGGSCGFSMHMFTFTHSSHSARSHPSVKQACDKGTHVMIGSHLSHLDSLHWKCMCKVIAACCSQLLNSKNWAISHGYFRTGETHLRHLFLCTASKQNLCRLQPCKLAVRLHKLCHTHQT